MDYWRKTTYCFQNPCIQCCFIRFEQWSYSTALVALLYFLSKVLFFQLQVRTDIAYKVLSHTSGQISFNKLSKTECNYTKWKFSRAEQIAKYLKIKFASDCHFQSAPLSKDNIKGRFLTQRRNTHYLWGDR